ncbi:ABC transporter permease [Brevibacterium sp. 50QC2O2]|jgi:peptide/nickel transport system permease protein|uniref:ABC transporter permease n=1 Tax=unclassified Brevibacterium TaxID=2614124 RepID=UPI00211D0A69|nr:MULTISPECIES: ABC transporter permease [unclassified Brevibacterium]MCQ9369443.1 ABC transporter permease [Brevibacterium sp. 91QC2O2]MCQ9388500.1 ABC transporter permease [Brevibacterium sp. 50QC2O2]
MTTDNTPTTGGQSSGPSGTPGASGGTGAEAVATLAGRVTDNSKRAKIRRSLTPARTIAAIFLILVIVVSVGSVLFPVADPLKQDVVNRFAGPGNGHFLGTDELGRDTWARLLQGVRVELLITVTATLIAMVLGTVLGLLAGWYQRLGDLLLMRVVDVILAFPPIIIALMATTLYGTNKATLVLVMGILFIPSFARVVHGQVMSVAGLEFVAAAQVFGAGTWRRIFTVVLPNCLTPIIVQFTTVMAAAILLESGLSFLGLGVQAPEPSLGSMVAGAQRFMTDYPVQLIIPAVAVSLIILSFGLVGDFLRDVLDPRR